MTRKSPGQGATVGSRNGNYKVDQAEAVPREATRIDLPDQRRSERRETGAAHAFKYASDRQQAKRLRQRAAE